MISNTYIFNPHKFVFNEIFIHITFFIIPNVFLFNRNYFVFNKKYFYQIFFHSSKIFFNYMNFPFITFLVSISCFAFVFAKVRILHSVRNLNNSTRAQKRFKEEY